MSQVNAGEMKTLPRVTPEQYRALVRYKEALAAFKQAMYELALGESRN